MADITAELVARRIIWWYHGAIIIIQNFFINFIFICHGTKLKQKKNKIQKTTRNVLRHRYAKVTSLARYCYALLEVVRVADHDLRSRNGGIASRQATASVVVDCSSVAVGVDTIREYSAAEHAGVHDRIAVPLPLLTCGAVEASRPNREAWLEVDNLGELGDIINIFERDRSCVEGNSVVAAIGPADCNCRVFEEAEAAVEEGHGETEGIVRDLDRTLLLARISARRLLDGFMFNGLLKNSASFPWRFRIGSLSASRWTQGD